MTKDKDRIAKSDVFYDGECSLCQAFVSKIHQSPQSDKFETRDVTRGFLPKDVSKEEALNEIYVSDEAGLHKNANAMLRILEAYPRYRRLARAGRLPIVNQVLMLGYFLVSRHRHFVFGLGSRLLWIKLLTIIGLLSGLSLSYPLWFGERSFPTSPFFTSLAVVPEGLIVIVGVLLVIAAILIFCTPRPQKLIFLFFGLAVVLCLFDQMRLQPWFYQYSFMLLALGLFSWDKSDNKGILVTLNILRMIIASIYFYSGLQKLNPTFVTEIFPWFVQPVVSTFAPSPLLSLSILVAGCLVPLIEMGIGLGFLVRRFSRVAVVFAGLMLAFLVASIGPFGYAWNAVVWPWNIVIFLFVYFLFWPDEDCVGRDWKGFLMGISWAQRLVVFLFVVMPAFSFVQLWDSYPSFSLYSGNATQGFVLIPEESTSAVPQDVQKFIYASHNETAHLDLQAWSFTELGVPIYPEERVYKSIFSSLCSQIADPKEFSLVLDVRPHTLTNNIGTYTCDDS